MANTFIDTLMMHIMESRLIPKVQVERAVGPILSLFMADVLTATFVQDPYLSCKIEMICPEFPFKKPDNNQSTNIDWLMVNQDRKQLLFVELKTSDTSVNTHQTAIYRATQTAIRNKGGNILIQDLETIRDASSEYGKYQYILENKVRPHRHIIDNCRDARIIYLVPQSTTSKISPHADFVLTFSRLSPTHAGPYLKEWHIIHGYLGSLDSSSRQSRNRPFSNQLEGPATINFADRCSFDEIMTLCEEYGNQILVGFIGGGKQLTARDLVFLRTRQFKWDKAIGGSGKKDNRNWIRGQTFYRLMKNKASYQQLSTQQAEIKHGDKPARWQGTYKFDEMVNHCAEQGDQIVIGFTGGKNSLC